MEPAAPVSARDQSGLDTVADFLKTTADVYQIAAAIHEADALSESTTAGCDLSSCAAVLGSSIQQMAKLLQADASSTQSILHLVRTCHKIGQDLSVHIERAQPSLSKADGAQADVVQFCVLWPRENVVVLGSRLSELNQQLKALQSHYEVTRNADSGLELALPVALLSLRDETPSSDVVSPSTTNDSLGVEHSTPLHKNDAKGMMSKTGVSNLNQGGGVRLASAGLVNDFLLESLAYKSMLDREDEVTEAHGQTLEWIFDDTVLSDTHQNDFSSQFTSWLRTPSLGSIYWITGKPGSGKSTLMRFLSQHPVSMDHLQHWAGSHPVCTAGFFFWTSGSQEQRSQTGLLRYLLHQLLSANPELMPSTFPELWHKLRHMTTKERINLSLEWTVLDLMAAFHALLDAALPRMNICLFIDGLDEFEGDHNGIVDFFKAISAGENGHAIKMCLSSRPWAVFEGAFQSSVPNARLQDLTYEDMHRYAKDQLRRNAAIKRLFKSRTDLGLDLVEDIVQQADGVFLWVRLAVERMLSRFQKDDGMNELQMLLQSFPRELDDFFNKLVFEDQTEAQIMDAAAIFQLMCAREVVTDFIKDESSASLTIWELAFALNENDDEPALERNIEEATDEEIVSRCEETAIHVLKRFSGLLTLHRRRQGNLRTGFVDRQGRAGNARSLADHKVKYIHRTVRDWLMDPAGAYARLQSMGNPLFDPHLRLLRSYVLRLKYPLEEVEHHRRLDEWYPDIALAMSHARYIANDPERLQCPLLNAMNSTLSWYWLTKHSDPFDHWARNSFGSYEVRMKAPPIRHPFLFLAVKFGLTGYVRGELESKPLCKQGLSDKDGLEDQADDDRRPTPLLSYATEFLCSRNKTIFPLSNPRLVEYLLTHPSQGDLGPNSHYTDFNTLKPTTPWLTLLRHLRSAHRRGWIEHYDIDPQGTARWALIVRLFIEVGGADVDAVMLKDAWDPEITAVGVFELLEDTYGAVEVQEIKALLKEKQQSAKVIFK
ncbi:hypothetical protein AK830_g3266 [Neonectria ditissima]|uniref:NACHT domain-containing protein n=1 Tax=Neonectria ditissima TaxID=78410 RepID=A0A0P7BQY1_9HYPO|nr:hypothetical protein AK830_g3266 [Neonectria ditissima]